MGVRAMRCLLFLLYLLFCSGSPTTESDDVSRSRPSPAIDLPLQKLQPAKQTEKRVVNELKRKTHRMLLAETKLQISQMDVTTPITTVPVINPTTPTSTTTFPTYNPTPTLSNPTPMTPPATTNPYDPTPTPSNPTPTTPPATTNPTPMTPPATTSPYTTPTVPTPSSSGQSWCVASQTASETALQVALDYACGYGGADCSAILQGGSCYNPDTVRDHASYAFNNYYQKNPIPTSCDFGGTAMITKTDPSTSTCQYPSTSTSPSVLNTTNPTGSTGFGSEPPSTSGIASMSIRMPLIFTLTCLVISLYLSVFKETHED